MTTGRHRSRRGGRALRETSKPWLATAVGPRYWGYAYFAFGVATTFGTTDVTLESSRLRPAVLGHSGFSFAVNTVILGLTVSFLITA